MENYITKVRNYEEVAQQEPNKDTQYIKGLRSALELVGSYNTKQELVLGLTAEVLTELDEEKPNHAYVKGLVSALKEALKLEGELDLSVYTVDTPVTRIVKNEYNQPIPKTQVNGEFNELWTMPEIIVTDITFIGLATEVK